MDVARREFLDLALVGPDLGLDAAREVDLDLLVTLRRLEDALGPFEQIAHAAAPPMVIAGEAHRGLAAADGNAAGRPCRRCPGVIEKSFATASTRLQARPARCR